MKTLREHRNFFFSVSLDQAQIGQARAGNVKWPDRVTGGRGGPRGLNPPLVRRAPPQYMQSLRNVRAGLWQSERPFTCLSTESHFPKAFLTQLVPRRLFLGARVIGQRLPLRLRKILWRSRLGVFPHIGAQNLHHAHMVAAIVIDRAVLCDAFQRQDRADADFDVRLCGFLRLVAHDFLDRLLRPQLFNGFVDPVGNVAFFLIPDGLVFQKGAPDHKRRAEHCGDQGTRAEVDALGLGVQGWEERLQDHRKCGEQCHCKEQKNHKRKKPAQEPRHAPVRRVADPQPIKKVLRLLRLHH